ncbi:hypothetical protein P152DRAFT_517694 [Eremomyces bilateralis CBS 781.70]|uniref:Uncharacterized protein n=1 Tax=Eremomyces bilateralis CBS 781.70 TaxID=1392243 RepID=A0A6G1FRD4_9PEZI|nr:uncharacterized protein P152DRAFT_517694 [Eremomyces bilateralis CBS 781.70]KAF1808249.1 hypothetical protein P152DRAFT_517694 [Eremomyces bilateralis CBS 781.70]
MDLLHWRKDERSALDIRRDYNSRIQRFFQQVEVNLDSFIGEGDSLEKLFRWSASVNSARRYLSNRLSTEQRNCDIAEEERDRLRAQLHEANQELCGLHSEIKQLVLDHSDALDFEKAARRNEVNKIKQEYKDETNRLKGQLLVNQDDFKRWPDDKLKSRFKELQILISNITDPGRVELRVPRGRPLDIDFDPTGFLARAGGERAHVLFKSIIWVILDEHFFSLPYGFGVLGPATPENTLLGAYGSWYTALGGKVEPLPCIAEGLKVFHTDQLANGWRSATFQSLYSAIVSPTASNATAAQSSANIDAAVKRISQLFTAASQYFSNPSPIQDPEILQAARLARDIAVQFGVHPAHLRLVIPQHTDRVQIGSNYHDYRNGPSDIGSLVTVDLVTLPGLQKVGNGRGGLQGVLTIVPCEICTQTDAE